MADIEINDLANFGVVRDGAEYMLPPEAFTYGNNVGFTEDSVGKMPGWAGIFGSPPIAPHFAIPIISSSTVWWIYVSLTKGYVYDGTSHTNITRQSAGVDVNYTPSNTRDWNGTILGGIPILNNGADVPQFWNGAYSTGNKLTNLTNWNSNHRAKVVRAFHQHLVAYNITKTSTLYPHMVKWSHIADPGTLPTSWDETDATKDAGEVDLPDVNSGVIQDAVALGPNMCIYKDNSTYVQRYIAGQYIFSFDPLYITSGILAPRCAAATHDGKYHFVATQDDIIVHNGQGEPLSVLSVPDAEGRFRSNKSFLFGDLDSTNYRNSFVFCNPMRSEMWFCYPSTGFTNPNMALVWNYQRGLPGRISYLEGITFRNAAIGPAAASSGSWNSDTQAWNLDLSPWEDLSRRKVIACGTDATKFYELNSGTTRDGSEFPTSLVREALGLLGRRRNGAWIEDFKQRKMLLRIWPKVSGGAVQVRVGVQETVDGSIEWGAFQTFDPATMMWLDVTCQGRAISIEFASNGSGTWALQGYKFEQHLLGNF